MTTRVKTALPSSGPISFSNINGALFSSSNTVPLSFSNTNLRSLFEDTVGPISMSSGYSKYGLYGGLISTWDSTGTHSLDFTTGTMSWGEDVDNRRVIVVAQQEDDSQYTRGRIADLDFYNGGDSGNVTATYPIVYNARDSGSKTGVTSLSIGWGKPPSSSGTIRATTDDPGGGSPSWNYKHVSVYAVYGFDSRSTNLFYNDIEDSEANSEMGSKTTKPINLNSDARNDSVYILAAGVRDSETVANITFEGTTYDSTNLDFYKDSGDGTMYSLGVLLWGIDGSASMPATLTARDSTDLMFAGAVLNKDTVTNIGFVNWPAQVLPPPPPPPPPGP